MTNQYSFNDFPRRKRGMRLLLPIKGESQFENLIEYWYSLQSGSVREAKLLHVVIDEVLKNTPYSSVEALTNLHKRDVKIKGADSALMKLSRDLKQILPDVRISYEIRTGVSISEEIINYANEWDADTILLLADKPDFMRSLFQQEVLKQVLSGAKQSVHIIKPGAQKQPASLNKLIS